MTVTRRGHADRSEGHSPIDRLVADDRSKAASDQSNGVTFPVNESWSQNAFSSRIASDPR